MNVLILSVTKDETLGSMILMLCDAKGEIMRSNVYGFSEYENLQFLEVISFYIFPKLFSKQFFWLITFSGR